MQVLLLQTYEIYIVRKYILSTMPYSSREEASFAVPGDLCLCLCYSHSCSQTDVWHAFQTLESLVDTCKCGIFFFLAAVEKNLLPWSVVLEISSTLVNYCS